jgi:hypothetical protein
MPAAAMSMPPGIRGRGPKRGSSRVLTNPAETAMPALIGRNLIPVASGV